MREEIEEVPLKENCSSIQYGYTQSASEEKVGPKFLRITDIQDKIINWHSVPYCKISEEDYKKYKLADGDILIARTGASTGTNAIYREGMPDTIFASYLIRIKVNQNFFPRFVYYFLQSPTYKDHIESIIGGSAQPNANAQQLTDISIPLLPIKEQHAIASILGSLDDKIALNRSMNSTLEAIGQALFRRWFVDFEFPDDEGKPYRSSGGEMVETELGEVPKGWRVGTLGDVCAKITDGSHFSPKESGGTHLIATVRDMGAYDFDLNGCKKISDEDYLKLIKNGCRPEKGDILFSKDGTMGITNLYFGHQDIVLLSSIAIIRPKNNMYSNYIYSYLKSSTVQTLIFGGFVSGSALPRLVLKDIKKIPILIPPEKIIMRFNQIINNPLIQIIENEKQSQTLTSIRDALLPKLMSGEIREDKSLKVRFQNK